MGTGLPIQHFWANGLEVMTLFRPVSPRCVFKSKAVDHVMFLFRHKLPAGCDVILVLPAAAQIVDRQGRLVHRDQPSCVCVIVHWRCFCGRGFLSLWWLMVVLFVVITITAAMA